MTGSSFPQKTMLIVCAVCRAFLVSQQKDYMVFKVRWCRTRGSPYLHCWTCHMLNRQHELAPVLLRSWLNTLFYVTLPGALHVGVSIDTVIIYVKVYYMCTLYTFAKLIYDWLTIYNVKHLVLAFLLLVYESNFSKQNDSNRYYNSAALSCRSKINLYTSCFLSDVTTK